MEKSHVVSYIDLEPAHTVLAQACLGGLFQPDVPVEC
jgi:hypothetical protein